MMSGRYLHDRRPAHELALSRRIRWPFRVRSASVASFSAPLSCSRSGCPDRRPESPTPRHPGWLRQPRRRRRTRSRATRRPSIRARRSPRSTAPPATAPRARATAPPRSRSIPSRRTGRLPASRTSRTARSSGRSPPGAARCPRGGTCPRPTAGRSSATSARSPRSDPEGGAVSGDSGPGAVGAQASLRAILAEMGEVLESARAHLRETSPGSELAAERDEHALAIFQEILSVPPLGLPPGELFALAMDRLSRLLAADRALLFVLDEATGRLVPRSGRGFRREEMEMLALDPGGGLIGRVFREKRVQTLDASAAPDAADPFVERFPVRQGIAVPVRTEGEVGGVLFAGRRALGAPFSTTDVLLLLVIAG